jgi:Sigma-70 region 2
VPRGYPVIYIRPPDIDLLSLLPWVRAIARKVAHSYNLRHSHLDDLVSTGFIRVLELSERFRPQWPSGWEDPENAFKGWAYREVLTSIQREAARLLGGGTFRSPKRVAGAVLPYAKPFSDLQGDSKDTQFDLPDTTTPPDYDWESDPHLFDRKGTSHT